MLQSAENPPDVGTLSTAHLIKRMSEQLSTLVRDELALARAEMMEKGKRAALGAGLLSGGGAFALFGVGVLIAAAVLALDLVWPAWAAALAVAGALFVVAGALALAGRSQLRRALPPVPASTTGRLTADARAIRAAMHGRGQR